ncbi:hypothetical protein [Bradyrhizobium genomosp. I (2014)]|uniref:hypothetical protein n=1 Tax=Bradyrhizobium genomosp. I (2014) TaxID=2683269 RepID=UPI0004BAFF4D|nr:hypothetical protein [Bradyrhizobium sp. CCBAU 43298]
MLLLLMLILWVVRDLRANVGLAAYEETSASGRHDRPTVQVPASARVGHDAGRDAEKAADDDGTKASKLGISFKSYCLIMS